jgi:teichuronic acid biosynthesis glycosyltransferase TuaG
MHLVSIIMPFYKKKTFFLESLNSALNQTYKNIEIIIIYDDIELTDLKYINKIIKKDNRVRVIKNNYNMGAGLSRNRGISNARGSYIAFLDCDDLWVFNKLEIQINYMKKNKISFSYTSYDVVDSKNIFIKSKKIPKKITFNDLLSNCDIGLSTVILDKKIINEECKFPDLKTKEDYVLWLSISQKIDLYGINLPLSKWRKLKDSLSANTLQKLVDGFSVYNKYMKFNYFKSIYFLMVLSINFLKKNYINKC